MTTKGRSSIQGGSLLVSSVPLLITRGLLVALLLSLVILVLSTMILHFSPLSETFVPYIIFGGTLLSILLGSVYVGKRTEEKGWLRGGLTGLFYVLALIILSYLFQVSFEPGLNIITKLFLGFSFGTLGGILGINS
ncbi:MAG: TIGR04086 family membrane protein [Dethiobacter sp.]|jgi:putative membrane protein (TIGR04086 family)|nr:MAG: TIGR04086 family membrane protein [Dethiobacter sp.]